MNVIDRLIEIVRERVINAKRKNYEFDRWCADYDFEDKCPSCEEKGVEYKGDPVADWACDACKIRWNQRVRWRIEQYRLEQLKKGEQNDKEQESQV